MNNSKKVAGVAGALSLIWLGLTAVIAASQRRLVFNPTSKREVDKPRSSAHRTRPIVLRAADGTKLSGWLMTPAVVGPHPGVIYFGGRSEEVSWVAQDDRPRTVAAAARAIDFAFDRRIEHQAALAGRDRTGNTEPEYARNAGETRDFFGIVHEH